MIFFMMIGIASPQAQRYCAANLFGPNLCNAQKNSKKMDAAHSPSSSKTTLNNSEQDIADKIVTFIKRYYKAEDVIAFSLSIDATSIAKMLAKLDKFDKGMALVGGAAPNHFIDVPCLTAVPPFKSNFGNGPTSLR